MDLRERLRQITLNEAVDEHPALLDALRDEFPHTVRVKCSEHPLNRYTCGVHAFYLVEDPAYLSVAEFALGRVYASAEFIDFLLANSLLRSRDCSNAQLNDLVLYLDNGLFRHVGRYAQLGRIESKWGSGQLCEHALWEVPSNYGSEVKCFEGPDYNESWTLFVKYAESEGFSFGEPNDA